MDLEDVKDTILDIVNTAVPVLFGLAIIFFLISSIRYGISGGEEERKNIKEVIIYSLIAIVVCLSVWGLVNMLAETFEFDFDQIRTKNENWESVIPSSS